jgi:hypothetical protein
MKVSNKLHALAALTLRKSAWYTLDRKLGGPHYRSGCYEEASLSTANLNHWTFLGILKNMMFRKVDQGQLIEVSSL